MIEQLTQPEMVELDGMVREAVDSHTRAAAEADLRKDIANNAKEKFKIKPSDFNMLVNERFKEKASETIARCEEISTLNEELIEARRKARGQA